MRPGSFVNFAAKLTAKLSLSFAVAAATAASALAQGAPPAPAGTGGGGGTGGSPLSPGGLYGTYSPQNIPAAFTPVENPIYGGTIFNYSPPTNPITAYLAACMQGAGLLAGGLGSALAMRNEMDRMNEAAGFQPYPGMNSATSRRIAPIILSNFKPEAGCQKFINKEGEVGPWGRTMLTELDKHKDVYEDHVPGDMSRYCPSFSSMDGDRRKLFWLWFFASVSQPESSCRSNATAAGPNGTAIGLFQLDPPACRRAGVSVSASELMEPANNIRCAVAVFANEMRNRDTIMIGTSRGSQGTYWGTLRNDDYNGARGGDIGAAMKTRVLLKQYPDCQK